MTPPFTHASVNHERLRREASVKQKTNDEIYAAFVAEDYLGFARDGIKYERAYVETTAQYAAYSLKIRVNELLEDIFGPLVRRLSRML